MLFWAAIFMGLAIVSAIFGFGGAAIASAEIAQMLFGIFVVLAVIAMIARAIRTRGTDRG